MADYTIWINDVNGHRRTEVTSLIAMEAARAVNDIGVLSLELSSRTEYMQIERDSIIEVYRTAPGGLKSLLLDTVWFARVFRRARVDGAMRYSVQAFSLNYLLTSRSVPYPKGGVNALMTDYADDVMKAVVRENLGALATDTARDLSAYMSVQADLSAAPIITKEFAYRPVIGILHEIAAASAAENVMLYFDVVPVTVATWQFRTYVGQRGVDHSFASGGMKMIEVSEERGNLSAPSLTLDYSAEATHIYVGGQGEGASRVVRSVSDTARTAASPYNRREVFIDAQNTADTDAMDADGAAELRAGRPRVVFEGQLVDVPSARFGVHWGLGDIVGAQFDGHRADCRVDAIDIKLDSNGGEKITTRLRSDSA